jgi:hypothetical protein
MITRSFLEKAYLVDGKSTLSIAAKLGCSSNTVSKYLKVYGISIRNLSDSSRIRHRRSLPISENFESFIDGCLLGDGNLHSPVGFQAVYHQDSSQREFIYYVSSVFNDNNYLAQSYDYDRFDKRTLKTYHSYSFNSVYSVELQRIYNRWYKSGIKVIPNDLLVTPTLLLIFYLGDGQKDRRCKNSVISSECFSKEEVSRLVYLIQNVGIDCHIQKDNRIRIPSSGFDNFINYIGGCPVGCYQYKFA